MSPAKQAVLYREQALGALAAGDLETARDRASAALTLDSSNLTLRAREVLFNVALARGELSQAAVELVRYKSQANLPASAKTWAVRSGYRLEAETAEGWADVATATAAAARVQADADLEPLEKAWLVQLAWRLEVRTPEQARDLPKLRATQEAIRKRPDLSAEDERWLEGAALRLAVLQAESTCSLDDARAALARMSATKDLRESDQRWASLAARRIDLRAMDAAGRDSAAQTRLDELASSLTLPEFERLWAQGYGGRLALKAALARGDAAEVARLRPAYDEWAVWEPACARLRIPDEVGPDLDQQEPGPWVRVGALGGVQGWRVTPTEGEDLSASLVTGDVLAGAAGLSAAGAWPLWRGLGPRGELSVAPALGPTRQDPLVPVGGRWDLHGALGVVWTHAQWEIFAGASVDPLRSSSTGGDSSSGFIFRRIQPHLGGSGTLSLGPGALRADLAGGWSPWVWGATGHLSYSLGEGEWRPQVGVEGRVTRGGGAWSLEALSSCTDCADRSTQLYGVILDWRGALVLGVEWRPAW